MNDVLGSAGDAASQPPNFAAAAAFLRALDPTAVKFTFQTFDDNREPGHQKDPTLAAVRNGSLRQCWTWLCEMSARGAGVFVTINLTDLRGRAASNIKAVRYHFADFDGAPLDNLRRLMLMPHIVVQTRATRFHVYWRVEGATLPEFKTTQMRINALLGSDPSVTDLSRVLRLPGFPHQKDPAHPFMVCMAAHKTHAAFTALEFEATLTAAEANHPRSPHKSVESSVSRRERLATLARPTLVTLNGEPMPAWMPIADPKNEAALIGGIDAALVNWTRVRAALAYIPAVARDIWLTVGMALRSTGAGPEAYEVWDAWSQTAREKYRAEDQLRTWESFKGRADGKNVTLGTLFHLAAQHGYCRDVTSTVSGAAVSAVEQPFLEPVMHDSIDLGSLLDVHTWAALDISPEPHLLGSLITPSSRGFLVGRTGLGKTLIAYAMAAGMASGQGFLHWRCDRPSRWLIIDGEMPTALIKMRAEDMIRRAGPIPPGYLTIYSLDRAEEFARLIPRLGNLEPINTPKGQEFVLKLAEALQVDGIIFDNVMSLVAGDQKDEVPWSETLPLVADLSKRRIAQVYLDHTGHNTDRQYGSSTKAWRFDAVGIMTPLPDNQRQLYEIGFTLSFEPPGKTRRRTPENRQDFATVTIRLIGDTWAFEIADRSPPKLSPNGRLWYKALRDTMATSKTPGRTTRTAWFAEAARTGLVEAIGADDTRKGRDAKFAKLRKYANELQSAGLIGIDGETVIDLRPQGLKSGVI